MPNIDENINKLKNGIYKNEHASYFIKDEKIIMNLKGSYYKTTVQFMLGAQFIKDLSKGIEETFDKAYESAPQW